MCYDAYLDSRDGCPATNGYIKHYLILTTLNLREYLSDFKFQIFLASSRTGVPPVTYVIVTLFYEQYNTSTTANFSIKAAK